MKPTPYQLDKLAAMNAANVAEIVALKAATATAKAEDMPALRKRAHKLERAVKEAARLERALGLHKPPPAGVQ